MEPRPRERRTAGRPGLAIQGRTNVDRPHATAVAATLVFQGRINVDGRPAAHPAATFVFHGRTGADRLVPLDDAAATACGTRSAELAGPGQPSLENAS